MATLREIRKRLRSAEQIKQITRAMEMVAASRLRRAQTRFEQTRPYGIQVRQLIDAVASASERFTHPLFEKRPVNKIGVVIVAADRGLAGAYNSNIFSAANRFLQQHDPQRIELFLFGRKAIEHYQSKPWAIHQSVSDWGGKITLPQMRRLTHELMDWFLSGQVDEIWFIYTNYITFMSRKVTIEKFLNIEPMASEENYAQVDYIFEPNPAEIYTELLPRYCLAKFQAILDESYTSELAARVVSMKAATSNAEDMIENLTLVRNKVRQAGITKEMLEIISSADGLK